MLHAIEKATRQKIDMMELPSTDVINDKRIDKFKQRITDTLAGERNALFAQLVEQYQQEHEVPVEDIAAALAQMLQGDAEFLLSNKPQKKFKDNWDDRGGREDRPRRERSPRRDREEGRDRGRNDRSRGERDRTERNRNDRAPRRDSPPDEGMERYRLEVGHDHEVKPGNIVGAIANEADIDSKYIGRINIYDGYSSVDLPEGMPKEMLNKLKNVRVSGQQLNLSVLSGDANQSQASETRGEKKFDMREKHSRKPRGNDSKDNRSRDNDSRDKQSDSKQTSSRTSDARKAALKDPHARVKKRAKGSDGGKLGLKKRVKKSERTRG
jgi:ATP-dependent RNA helicase DeaD